MTEKDNEKAPEATKKGDDAGAEEGKTPESGALGGEESPGDAPMGGGGQRHNTKAGSKVSDDGGRDAREG